MPSTMTIRFGQRDSELQAWLSQFAATYDMSKVVKLACYLLAGLHPDDGLLALLPNIREQGTAEYPNVSSDMQIVPGETNNDALAAVMQELSALREAVIDQQNGDASDEEGFSPAPLSDSRRRRKSRPHRETLPTYNNYADSPEEELEARSQVASSGLDMSSRRKRPGSPRRTSSVLPSTPDEFDVEDARQRLLRSLKAYGREVQKGH
jgi:hypothetical protein